MDLNFTVSNLKIERTENQTVVDDSSNFLRAVFSFEGEMWSEIEYKTAVFSDSVNTYRVVLDEDSSCFIPSNVLHEEGFCVGISASIMQNKVLSTFYTNKAYVSTKESCFSSTLNNSAEASDIYEQIIGIINGNGLGSSSAIPPRGDEDSILYKPQSFIEGNFARFDTEGCIVDSGMNAESVNNKLDKLDADSNLQNLIVIANSDGTISASSYTFNDVKKFIPRVRDAVDGNIPMFNNTNVSSTEDYGYIVDSGMNIHDFLTEHQDISGKEDISNKVTSVSSTSTDTEYPSAKCIYELIGDIETLLGGI